MTRRAYFGSRKRFLIAAGLGYLAMALVVITWVKGGVALAIPMANLGGFIVEADEIRASNLDLRFAVPGSPASVDTSAREYGVAGESEVPTARVKLDGSIYSLRLWKQFYINSNTCLEIKISTPDNSVTVFGDGYTGKGGLGEKPGLGPANSRSGDAARTGSGTVISGNELQIWVDEIRADPIQLVNFGIDEQYTEVYEDKFWIRSPQVRLGSNSTNPKDPDGPYSKVYINAHKLIFPYLRLPALRLGVAVKPERNIAEDTNGTFGWFGGTGNRYTTSANIDTPHTDRRFPWNTHHGGFVINIADDLMHDRINDWENSDTVGNNTADQDLYAEFQGTKLGLSFDTEKVASTEALQIHLRSNNSADRRVNIHGFRLYKNLRYSLPAGNPDRSYKYTNLCLISDTGPAKADVLNNPVTLRPRNETGWDSGNSPELHVYATEMADKLLEASIASYNNNWWANMQNTGLPEGCDGLALNIRTIYLNLTSLHLDRPACEDRVFTIPKFRLTVRNGFQERIKVNWEVEYETNNWGYKPHDYAEW